MTLLRNFRFDTRNLHLESAPHGMFGKKSAMLGTKLNLAAAMIICVFGIACYSSVIHQDYVNLDDPENFLENPNYSGISAENLHWMFTEFHMGHWHPLTWLSLAIEYELFVNDGELNPKATKVVNVLLHLLNAFLIFCVSTVILNRNTSSQGKYRLFAGGLIAAVLFLVHPQRVESVAWATERRDVLSTAFLLLAFLSFVQYWHAEPSRNRTWLYWLSIVAFVCSLMSKAWGITFPVVLIVFLSYDHFVTGRSNNGILDVRRLIKHLVPYVLLSIAAAVLAIKAQDAQGALVGDTFDFSTRLAIACYSLAWYPLKTWLPTNLYPAYLIPDGISLSNPEVAFSIMFLMLLFGVGLYFRKRLPGWLAAFFLYIVLVSPVSGLTQSGFQLVADRYGYVALIPFWIAAGWACVTLYQGATKQAASFMLISLLVLMGLMVGMTRYQVSYWENGNRLWQHTLDCDPDNYVALCNNGFLLAQSAQYDAALENFLKARKAVKVMGDSNYLILIENNLAIMFAVTGKKQEAMDAYRRVLAVSPDDPKARLGLAELTSGQPSADSISQLRKMVAQDPGNVVLLEKLGLQLLNLGKLVEAESAFMDAVENEAGNATIHFNLGLAQQYQQKLSLAEQNFVKSIEYDSANKSAYNQLGVLYLKTGRFEQAVNSFLTVQQLEPGHVNSSFNLGMAYLQLGNRKQAKASFEKTVQRSPSDSKVNQAAKRQLSALGGN